MRHSLRVLLKADCVDTNVSYRLINTKNCATAIYSIPENISLANVALAVALRKAVAVRHGAIPIRFTPRLGGAIGSISEIRIKRNRVLQTTGGKK